LETQLEESKAEKEELASRLEALSAELLLVATQAAKDKKNAEGAMSDYHKFSTMAREIRREKNAVVKQLNKERKLSDKQQRVAEGEREQVADELEQSEAQVAIFVGEATALQNALNTAHAQLIDDNLVKKGLQRDLRASRAPTHARDEGPEVSKRSMDRGAQLERKFLLRAFQSRPEWDKKALADALDEAGFLESVWASKKVCPPLS